MRKHKSHIHFFVCPGVTAEFLKTMTQNLNFSVDLHQPQLPVTGIFNHTTQQWNGVMGELVSDAADFSISPTAITEIRSKYVTFSSGFMLKYNRKVENPQRKSFKRVIDLMDYKIFCSNFTDCLPINQTNL